MKRNFRLLIFPLIAVLLTLSLGCTSQAKEPAETATPEADSSLVWRITVEESELTASISSTKAFVEYGGEVNQVSYSDQPAEGYAYLLVLLNIDKLQPGKEKFLWSALTVVDADGTAYARHENDTFLELHGLPRIKATDLSIGNNHGYVCFEVPLAVDSSSLTLVYASEDSAQQIALTPTVTD